METRSRLISLVLIIGLTSALAPARAAQVGVHVPTEVFPLGVAVDPSLNRTYILGFGDLAVLDGATNSITTVTTGIFPPEFPELGSAVEQIAVNPTNHQVYLLGREPELGIFDGLTQTLVHRLPLPPEVGVRLISVNPQTNTIYIAGFAAALVIVNGETFETSIVPLPSGILGLAVNAETNQIYVQGFTPFPSLRPTLIVLDGATLQVTATIELEGGFGITGGATIIAVNEATNKVYLPTLDSPNNRFMLVVVDGTTLTVEYHPINSVPEGIEQPKAFGPALIGQPIDIAVDRASDRIYILAAWLPFNRDVLVEIDGGPDHHKRLLPIAIEPVAMAVNPVTGFAYLAGRLFPSNEPAVLVVKVN